MYDEKRSHHKDPIAVSPTTENNVRLPPPPVPATPPVAGRSAPRRIDSRSLLGDGGELVIVHDGMDYRLRLTRQGKLILTK